MTFLNPVFPPQTVLHDRKAGFGKWAVKFPEALFQPKREPNYSLDTIVHFFFRQFGQPYEQVMLMDENRRDAIMKLELDLLEKEKQQMSKKNGNSI
jgi:hypothetical protein